MLLLAALALLPRRAPTYWRPSALLGGKLSELRFSSSSAESSDSVARDDSQAGRTAGSAAPGSSSGQSQQVAAGAAVAVTRSRRASPSDEPSADAVTWLFGEASSLARAAKADGSAVSPKYLTELSTAACSVAELGRFVAANEARFNAFNTVSCLTRLAKLVSKDADLKRRSQRANAAEAEQALVLTRLLEMMVEVRAYSMDVVNLSNAAFALGELKAYATGRGIAAIVDRLATDLEPSASAFLPQSYASSAAAAAPAAAAAQNTSRAPSNGYAGGSTGGGGGRARFGKPYERTLAAAANGYCLASISYPLAQCRVSDARAWDWLALATQSKLLPPGGAGRRGRGAAAAAASPAAPSTITPAQLTNILKAFALAGVRSVELAEAAAPAVLAAAAGPADLAYGAWSLSRMGLTTAGFYAPLAQERLEGSIKVMGPKQLSLVSSAYVTADLYEPNFFHALAQQCADKLKYSDYASFTRIVKSFAAVGHRHPKLSAQALAFADRHVKKLRPTELAALMSSLAAMGITDVSRLQQLWMSLQPELSQLPPSHLADLAAGLLVAFPRTALRRADRTASAAAAARRAAAAAATPPGASASAASSTLQLQPPPPAAAISDVAAAAAAGRSDEGASSSGGDALLSSNAEVAASSSRESDIDGDSSSNIEGDGGSGQVVLLQPAGSSSSSLSSSSSSLEIAVQDAEALKRLDRNRKLKRRAKTYARREPDPPSTIVAKLLARLVRRADAEFFRPALLASVAWAVAQSGYASQQQQQQQQAEQGSSDRKGGAVTDRKKPAVEPSADPAAAAATAAADALFESIARSACRQLAVAEAAATTALAPSSTAIPAASAAASSSSSSSSRSSGGGKHGFGPTSLARLVSAFAIGNRQRSAAGGAAEGAMFAAVARRAATCVEDFSAVELANLLFAFAAAGHRANALFARAAVPLAESRLREMGPRHVAMAAHAFAAFGLKDEDVFAAVVTQVLATLDQYSEAQINRVTKALALAGYANSRLLRHKWEARMKEASDEAAQKAVGSKADEWRRRAWELYTSRSPSDQEQRADMEYEDDGDDDAEGGELGHEGAHVGAQSSSSARRGPQRGRGDGAAGLGRGRGVLFVADDDEREDDDGESRRAGAADDMLNDAFGTQTRRGGRGGGGGARGGSGSSSAPQKRQRAASSSRSVGTTSYYD